MLAWTQRQGGPIDRYNWPGEDLFIWFHLACLNCVSFIQVHCHGSLKCLRTKQFLDSQAGKVMGRCAGNASGDWQKTDRLWITHTLFQTQLSIPKVVLPCQKLCLLCINDYPISYSYWTHIFNLKPLQSNRCVIYNCEALDTEFPCKVAGRRDYSAMKGLPASRSVQISQIAYTQKSPWQARHSSHHQLQLVSWIQISWELK